MSVQKKLSLNFEVLSDKTSYFKESPSLINDSWRIFYFVFPTILIQETKTLILCSSISSIWQPLYLLFSSFVADKKYNICFANYIFSKIIYCSNIGRNIICLQQKQNLVCTRQGRDFKPLLIFLISECATRISGIKRYTSNNLHQHHICQTFELGN